MCALSCSKYYYISCLKALQTQLGREGRSGDSICCLLKGHTDVTQDTAEIVSPLVLTTKTISK